MRVLDSLIVGILDNAIRYIFNALVYCFERINILPILIRLKDRFDEHQIDKIIRLTFDYVQVLVYF